MHETPYSEIMHTLIEHKIGVVLFKPFVSGSVVVYKGVELVAFIGDGVRVVA